jgi:hypothetical protein
MRIKFILSVYILIFFVNCSNDSSTEANPPVVTPPIETPIKNPALAKFEPKEGQVLVFVGQSNEAIGGTVDFNQGYFDFFQKPSGFTMYTNINLTGVYQTADWGDGPENLSKQLADADFDNSVLAIGLSIVNEEAKIATGGHDANIKKMGEFFLSLGKRPIFLRIGYEFDGSWNNYNKSNYVASFRRIKEKLDGQGVTNIAYIWQSAGQGTSLQELESWYPGDQYVDWCAYSFFNNYAQSKMIAFAANKKKPVFIAEATPAVTDFVNDPKGNTGLTKEMILSNPNQATLAWNDWFVPFFITINDNPKTVKAISYINTNWKDQPMWKSNPTFKNLDSRIQLSSFITEKWNEEIAKSKYLKPSSTLFDVLYSNQ